MEFLKNVRRRSFLSEVAYIGLNLAYAVALVLIVNYTNSVLLAIGLVLVSKWRVLAVRPRFWFANIQSNLVDFIVSLGVVASLYSVSNGVTDPGARFFLMALITVLYSAWLILLKPRSKRTYVVTQAGIALFVGVSVLFSISYAWPASAVVALMWLIGYAVARHTLVSYHESHLLLLSLVWGFILAEIGWVAYHWVIAYSLPFSTSLQLPQVAVIVTTVGFVAYKAYDSFYHHQKIRTNDVLLPALFCISIVATLLLFFNNISTVI